MKNLSRLVVLLILSVLISCSSDTDKTELIIFHAGSLAVPFTEISKEFQKEMPGVVVRLESAGSRKCARKIIDLDRKCDIMASADYTVIDELLIPEYADWNIKFASNEMTLVYTEASRYSDSITSDNWFEILAKDDVKFGRSDPNSDPCGYRAVLTMKLAGNHYGNQDIVDVLLNKDLNMIRPKETDLLALLESNALDYIYLYRSVAEQHQLEYLLLPDEINLKNPDLSDWYETAEVDISGKKPGETITKRGEPMVYGITVINNSENRDVALKFIEFLLKSDYGMKIMEKNGQPSMVPSNTDTYKQLPVALKNYALEN